MQNFHSHLTFTALYMDTEHIFSCYKHSLIEQTRNLLKLWIQIQQYMYTATDFQGWSKITLKIKIAHFSTLEVGLEKLTLTAI